MRAVDAYGLENETDSKIELWARCDGVRIDPSTGTVVHGAPKVHETRKDSMVIMKTPDWSQNRLADIISRSAFFAPDGDRKWEQDFTADGVHAS
jgi:threonine synthase